MPLAEIRYDLPAIVIGSNEHMLGDVVGALVGGDGSAVGKPLQTDSAARLESHMKRSGIDPFRMAASVLFTKTKLHVNAPPSKLPT